MYVLKKTKKSICLKDKMKICNESSVEKKNLLERFMFSDHGQCRRILSVCTIRSNI